MIQRRVASVLTMAVLVALAHGQRPESQAAPSGGWDSYVLRFLDAFEAAATAQAAGLETFLASDTARLMSPKSRLAVAHGLRQLDASAQWARSARREYR